MTADGLSMNAGCCSIAPFTPLPLPFCFPLLLTCEYRPDPEHNRTNVDNIFQYFAASPLRTQPKQTVPKGSCDPRRPTHAHAHVKSYEITADALPLSCGDRGMAGTGRN